MGTSGKMIDRNLMVYSYSEIPAEWDSYVLRNERATFFHQIGYKRVIEQSFGHKPYYLAFLNNGEIRGILPLFLVKSRLFGFFLVSLPFCDYGGIVADSESVQKRLWEKAIEIAQKEQVQVIELQQRDRDNLGLYQNLEKVNLKLLLDTEERIWRSFKGKVRNQIRKAQKAGLQFKVGGIEKLPQFYKVFATSMRDLGTPVYPLSFFDNLLKSFPSTSEVLLVTYGGKTIGGAIAIYFKETMEVPWASSWRKYFKYCPNNLLYWKAIERGCQKGYKYFNFGRSTKNSGNYKFKKQWGAEDEQLHYQYYLVKGKSIPDLSPQSSKYRMAVNIWKRLPLAVTNYLGPKISRYIP